jgi:hypothetical protein
MRTVIVETPYGSPDPAERERNRRYLRACLHDCFRRGEAPMASHAIYTQPGVLHDGVPEERNLGIAAGFDWRAGADATAVYIDRGVTEGMRHGIADAERIEAASRRTAPHSPRLWHEIEYRELPPDVQWDSDEFATERWLER